MYESLLRYHYSHCIFPQIVLVCVCVCVCVCALRMIRAINDSFCFKQFHLYDFHADANVYFKIVTEWLNITLEKYNCLMFVPYIIRRSRNDQQYALICTIPLFYILAPTCFGSSLPSSGSFLHPSELTL
jgi:hypothetical protein